VAAASDGAPFEAPALRLGHERLDEQAGEDPERGVAEKHRSRAASPAPVGPSRLIRIHIAPTAAQSATAQSSSEPMVDEPGASCRSGSRADRRSSRMVVRTAPAGGASAQTTRRFSPGQLIPQGQALASGKLPLKLAAGRHVLRLGPSQMQHDRRSDRAGE